jgi:site-specific recombinase XerD
MWDEIAAWQATLTHRPDLSTKTVALYTQDVRRFATWLSAAAPGLPLAKVTTMDAKSYRDHLLAQRYAPTTINRALISLRLFFDSLTDSLAKPNPFRHLTMIEIVEPAPVALSKSEWNAVRRAAEQAARRDQGLALALASLFRYAGPRVAEVAALQIPDVPVSARRGVLIIRRGKGLKHREIPLVQEVRDPLEAYLFGRQRQAERWRERALARGETVPTWSRWPDGHLFLGQRGPLAERGMRAIIAKLGQAAKLSSALGPHDLRHTFAKSLLDPATYGLDRPPMPLPAIQQLLGHADISTTTIYTRMSAEDLARLMGTAESL